MRAGEVGGGEEVEGVEMRGTREEAWVGVQVSDPGGLDGWQRMGGMSLEIYQSRGRGTL